VILLLLPPPPLSAHRLANEPEVELEESQRVCPPLSLNVGILFKLVLDVTRMKKPFFFPRFLLSPAAGTPFTAIPFFFVSLLPSVDLSLFGRLFATVEETIRCWPFRGSVLLDWRSAGCASEAGADFLEAEESANASSSLGLENRLPMAEELPRRAIATGEGRKAAEDCCWP
jgi:hypothetical protein